MNGTIQKEKDSLSDFQGLLFVFECVVVVLQSEYISKNYIAALF